LRPFQQTTSITTFEKAASHAGCLRLGR